MRSRSLLIIALFLCSTAFAQTAGHYVLRANQGIAPTTLPYTVIDISEPFTASGAVSSVVIRTSATATCAGAFKVKFFHSSGGVFTPYAERGPFDITAPIVKVTLSPAVVVTAGDLIGITALRDCTGLVGQSPLRDANAFVYNGDVNFPVSVGTVANTLANFALAAYAAPSGTAEVRTTILIAAGSATGAFGSQFRTDVFLTNPRRTPSQGRLVYHPEATEGKPTDPSWPFSIEFARSLTLPNFVAENLQLTGKGSIDVYTTIGFEPPVVSARIYETSSTGTKGFTMDALTEDEALDASLGDVGVLFGPADPAGFRMNMGFRTLDEPTEIVFQLVRQNGAVHAAREITYPANFYQQVDVAQFFGTTLQPGDTILLFTDSGAAFVYGSIVDNASNDPSMQVAKALE